MSAIDIPDDVINKLSDARTVVVMTGAGVSTESGIPSFRDDITGFWANYDPQELATPEGFAKDPETVTRWYDHRRENVSKCKPNAGHYALAELENHITNTKRGKFTLLTQNIDRLHQQAGSKNIIELHGSLWEWRCTKTGNQREYRDFPFKEYPPKSEWGGILRPAVVWFGENLPAQAITMAEQVTIAANVFLSIGTSALVYPAAGFIELAHTVGATTIEINRDETPISDMVTYSIRGLSGEILPPLVQAVINRYPKK